MTHAEIIRALGGPSALARRLGVNITSVLHWPRRGIPARYWHRIVELAEQDGISGVSFVTLSTKKDGGR